jgi:cob(I)alamin adenosyltransferase
MRLTRLYTRAGDAGRTRLADGREVDKDSRRVEAYGTVDELNSQLGVARASGLDAEIETDLARIQNELFDLGADLATPEDTEVSFPVPRILTDQVAKLEKRIDVFTESTGPLENFVLPGGAPGAAALHVARTVCRRAERAVAALSREETIGEAILPYLNRLSDLLFAMARFENQQREVAEPLWEPSTE